jgi:hypothetical protein
MSRITNLNQMKYIFNSSKTDLIQARQGVKTFIQNHNDNDLVKALSPEIKSYFSINNNIQQLTIGQIDEIVNTIVFSN